MKIETLPYEADGLSMVGQISFDDTASSKRPGVLVFPEIFGLGDNAKSRAARITQELGYVALACDLWGEQKVYTDLDEVMAAAGPLRGSAEKVRARTIKALEALVARPEVDASKIACIGYCYGGTMSFELALAGADVLAAIGFHSGLTVTPPQDAGHIKGKVLAMVGADDPSIQADAREAFAKMLTEAKVDWTVTVYGGVVHSFTNKQADHLGRPAFARYDEAADRRSWAQMAALFDEVFA